MTVPTFAALEVVPAEGDSLVVKALRTDGKTVVVRFAENHLAVSGAALSCEWPEDFRRSLGIGSNRMTFSFNGFRYSVDVSGLLLKTDRGIILKGKNDQSNLEIGFER